MEIGNGENEGPEQKGGTDIPSSEAVTALLWGSNHIVYEDSRDQYYHQETAECQREA